jgi:hypothetical protein
MLIVAADVESILARVKAYEAPPTAKWMGNNGR